MDLTPYVAALRHELVVAAEAGGEQSRELAERLIAPLESAVRLVLLDALTAAAGEITSELAPGSVEVRLRGREPSFVVTPAPAEPADQPSPAAVDAAYKAPAEGQEGTMSRINLRLWQDLKDRVEDAAGEAGMSVNSWLVRAAASAAMQGGGGAARSDKRTSGGGEHVTGWVS